VRYRDGGRDRDYGGHRREHPRGGGLDPSVPTPVVVLRNLHPDTAQDKVCFFITPIAIHRPFVDGSSVGWGRPMVCRSCTR
jgi:hypothetical protein